MVSGMDMGAGRVGVRNKRYCTMRSGRVIHVVICIPLNGVWNPFVLIFNIYNVGWGGVGWCGVV